MKDRLTLAFFANASGDLKHKPILVYHSENLRAFKAKNITKDRLLVFWRSNAKACVTMTIFIEWVNVCFGPAVKNFLEENNLSLKCLLILDNAPAHPPGLKANLHPDFCFIKVLYLPPNTTPLLQPMDQSVIGNFKKLYTKHLFKRCFEVTEITQFTQREFWKEHFDIVQCLKMIDKAWNEVSRCTLNSSWKKLWPAVVAECDFKSFEPSTEDEAVEDPAFEEVVEEIISIVRSKGLVVDKTNVDNLIDEHREELTTEDLKELEAMQLTIIQDEENSSGGEDGGPGGD
ncbi:tigger transposable element-derived protein 1-like [Palaemon carinicauda]|uniref:tigger transposable element-derived protein 1-like n=1 Tax=Palaemon carinicauda TaxID=392227 RepID=UPI0035B622F9